MPRPSSPNILVFLTDDHGQWAANCYGAHGLHTPTLDHLAATGARMTHAFTPSPVCSPARACFFTGRFPSQHGVHDWLETWRDATGDHPGLQGQTTLATLLKHVGYQTALVGKWHCGHENTPQPGFDRWFTYDRGYQFPHRGSIRFVDGAEVVTHVGQGAHAITERAVQFLRDRDPGKPYFMTVGYVDTHSPFDEHPERLVAPYRRCALNWIPNDVRPDAYPTAVRPDYDDADERRERLAQYGAAVTMIDEQVGRLLDELEARGERENTIVVYTSDHGHMNGHHSLWCKGNATTPQNFLDESIRVPCLLSWPGRIREGQVRDEMVDHCDLFATLLDAAGVTPTAAGDGSDSPGRSYLPLLTGRNDGADWRTRQVCEYGNARMIRTDTAKLVRRYPVLGQDWPDEFYDLRADPREAHNRIHDPAYADVIADLSAQLDAFFARHTLDERDGRRLAEQPVCNSDEPWRRSLGADAAQTS